jgi:hypothetical protein
MIKTIGNRLLTGRPLDYWLIYEELLDIEAACHGKLAQMLPEHCIILL